MNILIFEAYTDANVGSCALVENAIKVLKSRFPESSIKVMAHRPAYFRSLYGVKAIPDILNYPFLQARFKQILWLFKTIYWMFFCWLLAPFIKPTRKSIPKLLFRDKLEPLLWADIAISVGAERINDKYFKNIAFSLCTYSLILRLQKKLVLFPSTIGPLFFKSSQFFTKRVLRKIDIIYTRDELSATIVEGLIGREFHNIVRSIDLAILQNYPRPREIRKMIPGAIDTKIVGISVMHWSYFKNKVETPFSNYKEYTRQIAFLADSIIELYNVNIVFYPTNYQIHGCREDDLSTSLEVRYLMRKSSKAYVVMELPTPSELKGMLACSEINITTRMHACILSTSSGTPTISINYLFKVREYMKSIGLEDFSIDIEEFNAEWILSAFGKMWSERTKWQRELTNTIQMKSKELLINLDRLYDLI